MVPKGYDVSVTLRLISGSHEATVPTGRPFVVGRGRTADLVLTDTRVSREHLVIEPADHGWTVRDVSSNGTWLGGQRVQRVAVESELRLRLGTPTGPELAVVPIRADSPEVGETDRDPHSQLLTLQPNAPGYGPGPKLPPSGRPDRPDDFLQADSLEGAHERRNVHPLFRGTLSIGRSGGNDITVGDLLASRWHAELLIGDSGVEIVDLGSANGTFVNGSRVTRAVLAQRDVIAVGHHLFQVEGDQLVEYLDAGDVTFEADGLSVFVGDTQILHSVSFRLPGQALLAVIGPSGAGKSTLLNALTGFRPADQGTVRYAGRDMYNEYDELRRRIGHVPQDDLLHTTLTVRKALDYGAELRFPPDTTRAERRARADEVLAELGLTQRAGLPVQKLSGGQRKRTSVALELLTRPTLLFLDEPTSGLDPGLDKNVMGSLRGLADDGRTVVVVTHSVAQLDVCDYILVLAKGGYIAYFGPPRYALLFLGKSVWADVFEMLEETPGEVLADRFRESRFYVPASVTAPPARPVPAELPSVRQQSVLFQTITLSRRMLSVIASDRSYLGLVIAFPFLLGIMPRVVGRSLDALPNRPNQDAPLILLVMVLCACFMGMANSVREIVKERAIYRRERAIGLSRTAYLAAKVVVLTLVTAVQSVVFTTIGILGHEPRHAVVLGSPLLELTLAVTVISLSSAMIGLVISALVDNSDKAMPLLVLITMSQVMFSGGLVAVHGKRGLEEISAVAPARWGFAAVASAADLNNVQKRGDPQLNPDSIADPQWAHTAAVYLTDVLACLTLGILAVIITALLLRRMDPKIVHRRFRPTPVGSQ